MKQQEVNAKVVEAIEILQNASMGAVSMVERRAAKNAAYELTKDLPSRQLAKIPDALLEMWTRLV